MRLRCDGPFWRLLHAALDRLSLHHIAHQATRRGYMLCEDEPKEDGAYIHERELEAAGEYFRRGDTAEALIWLERALPDSFSGLSTAAVPAPSR